MAFELKQREALGKGIRRIAKGELKSVLSELEGKTESKPEDAIHEARKSLKKLRALARLARGTLGDKIYKRDNLEFRDTARALSNLRDADVALGAFDALIKSQPGKPKFADIRRLLVENREQIREAILKQSDRNADVVERLDAALTRVSEWPLSDFGWDHLEAGLRRTYRASKDSYEEALEKLDPPLFHEMRKRAKHLLYQVRLLRSAEPSAMHFLIDELDKLTEAIGAEHDLAILQETLASVSAPAESLKLLEPLIEGRREECRREALQIGGPIFVEKPAAFSSRIIAYARLWKKSKRAL